MHPFNQPQRKRRPVAARRPGAARKPGTPTSLGPAGLRKQHASAAAVSVRRARKISGDSSRASSGDNPFLDASSKLQPRAPNLSQGNPGATASAMTSSHSGSTRSQGNPGATASAMTSSHAGSTRSQGNPGATASAMTSSHAGSTRLQGNPGATASAMTSSHAGSTRSHGNPFLAQIATQASSVATAAPVNPTPFGEQFTSHTLPPPPPSYYPPSSPLRRLPSYAAIVTGKGAQGPVPGFIAHGPRSIPPASQHEAGPIPQAQMNTGGHFGHPQQPPASHAHQLMGGHTHQHPSGAPSNTLHLKNLPEHFNNPPTLRNYFSKFGQITVLNCHPEKRYANVGFSTQEAAVKAKRSGRLLSEEIKIFWYSRPPQQSQAAPEAPQHPQQSQAAPRAPQHPQQSQAAPRAPQHPQQSQAAPRAPQHPQQSQAAPRAPQHPQQSQAAPRAPQHPQQSQAAPRAPQHPQQSQAAPRAPQHPQQSQAAPRAPQHPQQSQAAPRAPQHPQQSQAAPRAPQHPQQSQAAPRAPQHPQQSQAAPRAPQHPQQSQAVPRAPQHPQQSQAVPRAPQHPQQSQAVPRAPQHPSAPGMGFQAPRLVALALPEEIYPSILPPYMPPPQSSFPTGQTGFEAGSSSRQFQTESFPDRGSQQEERSNADSREAGNKEMKTHKILQASRKRQVGGALKTVIGTKRQRASDEDSEGEGLSVEVAGGSGGQGKRSVWERLGGKEGEDEGEEVKTTKRKGRDRTGVGGGDEEWTPQQQEGEGARGVENEQEDDEEDEGVNEGTDSVLYSREMAAPSDDMDTISRYAAHPYHLRSLHKCESFAGPRAPKAVLQVPRLPSKDGGASGVSVSKATVLHKPHPLQVGAVSPSYGPIPVLSLPPPPMPRGMSAADLYQSLDTRDEEMRKNSVKPISLTSAEAVRGTCPDMCPEKERYMREDRRRLSWFEVHPNSEPGAPKVDHQCAVKEYSGSAADKVADLPHHLRPESILLMTMDYLVTSVMDAGEGRVELWYDFIWNRTRAIRKDITLQHLCSEGCVELTEKCSRFHIMCAYLLCEEEMSVFDQKMNHENLTKSVITLTQFYRDLRIEQNILCRNEAEFCCYDILLHLRDGNVLNIVERYSGSVRQAPEVRFAVNVALSFSSNNYTKFFKLVKSESCSFLCACIIHCYFIEMRTEALRVMIKAYTHSKPTHFPLAKFTEILGFENEAEATAFCVHFDLSLGKKLIKLSREFTQQPTSPLPLLLAPSLVGLKRVNRCLGEVVNGGPLPPPPRLPQPYDSFAPGTPMAPPTPVRTELARPGYTDQELGVAIGLVLEEVVDEEVPSVAMEVLRNLQEQEEAVKQAVMCDVCEGVLSECVGGECTDVAMTTLADAQREWRLQEDTWLLEEVTRVVAMEIEVGVVTKQVGQVGTEVFRESREEYIAMVMSVCNDVLREGVRSVVGEVGEEVVREAETKRQEKLEKLEKQVLKNRLQRHWKSWRRSFKACQHRRLCVASIPPLPPLLPLSHQLTARQSLGERRTTEEAMVRGERQTVSKFLETERNDLEEKRKLFLAPIDLPSLLHDPLLISRPPTLPHLPHSHHTSPHLYWSLAVLHAHEAGPMSNGASSEDARLLVYLEQKLGFCPPGGEPSSGQKVSSLGVRKISISSTPLHNGMNNNLKIAVKSLKIREFDRQQLTGTCAMILLAPTPHAQQTPQAYRDDIVRRVLSVERQGWWAESRVPMLVLAPFHVEEAFLAHWNALRIALKYLTLKAAAFFSDVTFDTLHCDLHIYSPMLEKQVCKGLKWLADHTPSQPPLTHSSLRDFVEEGVREYFVPLVSRDTENRKTNGLPSQAPHNLIALYNSVIAYLAEVVASPTLQECSWPVAEFAPRKFSNPLAPEQLNFEGLPPLAWNEDYYLDKLREAVMSLQLVPLHIEPTLKAGWSEQCEICLTYLQEYVGHLHRPLTPRVKALLRSYSSHMTSDQSDPTFPWDHVITTCIDHLISTASSSQWVTCFHGDTKHFAIPTKWLMAEAGTSLECAHSLTFEPQSPRAKRHRRNLSDSYLLPPHIPTHSPTVTLSRSPLATTLSDKIMTEKQLSLDFEKQLEKWLNSSEELPTPSPPPPLLPRHTDHAPSTSKWAGSLEHGLQLLKMKIKTSRFQDRVDARELQRITSTFS